MKIAIVHDSLTEFGGSERILNALFHMYPDAHCFTSVYGKNIQATPFSKQAIRHLPIPQRFFAKHPSLFQSWSPLFWRTLNLERYDAVIASSGHLMANLVAVRRPVFIQYIHTLPKNIFALEAPTPWQRIMPYGSYIRRAYMRALKATPYIVTNSRHMQKTLSRIAFITSECIYPPVSCPPSAPKQKRKSYFLIVSRLDRSKGIELAIQACNALGERLVIIGKTNEPTYERYLRRIAGPTIVFRGFQSDAAIRRAFVHAKAFLFTPHNEDFGIAPVEAMAYGAPVIAFYGGGAKETVIEGKTGVFFHDHSSFSLQDAMVRFDAMKFSSATLVAHANQFSAEQFTMKMDRYVRHAIARYGRKRPKVS